jgi:hypothetical protein
MWSKVNVSVLDHYQLHWSTNSLKVHGTDRYRPQFLSIRDAYWTCILNWHPSGLKVHPASTGASGSLSFKVFQRDTSWLYMRLFDIGFELVRIHDTRWIIAFNRHFSGLKTLLDITRASGLLRLQQLGLIHSHILAIYWSVLRSVYSFKIAKIN